jgi:hypothetical protein
VARTRIELRIAVAGHAAPSQNLPCSPRHHPDRSGQLFPTLGLWVFSIQDAFAG